MIYCEEYNLENKNYYGYIYITLDQKRNKVYIGHKIGLVENSINYFGSGKVIKLILKKRGTYFLKKTILGVCYTLEELLECETECKYFFNSFNPIYGYNISKKDRAPMHDRKHTIESRKKMSESQSGEKSWVYGTTRPSSTKNKISNSLLNHEVKVETKNKISIANTKKEAKIYICENCGKEFIEKYRERKFCSTYCRTRIPWNKDKTKETDIRLIKCGIRKLKCQ